MAFHIHVLLSTTLHQIHITKFKNVFRKSGFISVKLVLGRIIHAKPHVSYIMWELNIRRKLAKTQNFELGGRPLAEHNYAQPQFSG